MPDLLRYLKMKKVALLRRKDWIIFCFQACIVNVIKNKSLKKMEALNASINANSTFRKTLNIRTARNMEKIL